LKGWDTLTTAKAPNRLFSLEDLQQEYWRRTLRDLDDLVARRNGLYLHPSKRWEYPWALARAGLLPDSRVLDAGCGGSIFPVYLASTGLRTIACDRALPCGLACHHGMFLQYIRGDLTALPLAEYTFDAIFCISVIEHLEEKGALAAIREMRRVLRPGGRLLLTTDYYENSRAKIWYEGRGRRFPVDWHLFDETRLSRFLSLMDGLELEGEIDLTVDWDRTRAEMRRFHGYPYTSLGLAFLRT
jgi:SAM-dependent methyltransferase